MGAGEAPEVLRPIPESLSSECDTFPPQSTPELYVH
jgi:hypothetical protein